MAREFDLYGKPARWSLSPGLTRAPWMWRNVIASWPLWEGSGPAENIYGHARGLQGSSANNLTLYLGNTSEVGWLNSREGVGIYFDHTNDDSTGFNQMSTGNTGVLKFPTPDHTYEIVVALTEANAALNGVQTIFSNGSAVNASVGALQIHAHTSSGANYGIGLQQGTGGGTSGTHRSSVDYSTAVFSGDFGEPYHIIASMSGVGASFRARVFINGLDLGNLARTSGSSTTFGYSTAARVAIGGAGNINNGALRKGRVWAVNVLQGQIQAAEAQARAARFWEMFQQNRIFWPVQGGGGGGGGGGVSSGWGARVGSSILTPVRELILPPRGRGGRPQ
jgi:hypothetical protein